MPRRAEERPIRASDPDLALQAAMRQALERSAAPGVPIRAPDADAPAFAGRVAETAPLRAASGVSRSRGARAVVGFRRTRKKEAARPEPIADPHGRGGNVDLRA